MQGGKMELEEKLRAVTAARHLAWPRTGVRSTVLVGMSDAQAEAQVEMNEGSLHWGFFSKPCKRAACTLFAVAQVYLSP